MEGLRSYRLYGITMCSDFNFGTPLPPSEGAADLTFEYVREPRADPLAGAGELVFSSPLLLESGVPYSELYRRPGQDLLRFSEVVDFYISDDRITGHLLDPEYEFVVELRLLGKVLSFWFERQGIPMLHAAAVAAEGQAAVFIATNKGGKSSLAATMVQAGFPLLSDDLVGVQTGPSGPEARPGYPCMRFWPDQATHFAGTADHLELVHPHFTKRRLPIGDGGFGSFCDSPQPLGCFYLPQRREARCNDPVIEISALPPRHAVMELVRAAYLPRVVQAAGLSGQRLAHFGDIVRSVPVKRLIYPNGLHFLPSVREAILEDLRAEQAGRAAAVPA
jgi:hypothetical protein